ncbi:MAG: hypothetical protein K0R57_5375 [Paenibacillaceae bacterium]|jgi:uncharacterized protein (DUF58 family)|nr:hypothetical protein [Paenibacillaceae bacterium]
MSVSLLVIAALAALYLQGRLFRKGGLARLSYERKFDRSFCTEGDQVEMHERIANDKALPLPWLRLEALLSSELHFVNQDNLSVASGQRLQNHRSLFSLRGHTEIVRKHRVHCVRRGCYDLKTVTMSCGDLFGISQAVRTQQVDVRLLVYPRPAPLAELPLPWRGWHGEYTVRRWTVEDPFVFQGIREYRRGDPLRSIHWKATSRTGELHVREQGYTADRRIMVLLNVAVKEDMWGEVTDEPLIEWGIRCALTVVERGLAEGMPVGFGCNAASVDEPGRSTRIPPASGNLQHKDILDALAKLELTQQVNFPEFLRLESEQKEDPSDYVIISAFQSVRLKEQVEALRSRGCRVDVLPLEREVIRQ